MRPASQGSSDELQGRGCSGGPSRRRRRPGGASGPLGVLGPDVVFCHVQVQVQVQRPSPLLGHRSAGLDVGVDQAALHATSLGPDVPVGPGAEEHVRPRGVGEERPAGQALVVPVLARRRHVGIPGPREVAQVPHHRLGQGALVVGVQHPRHVEEERDVGPVEGALRALGAEAAAVQGPADRLVREAVHEDRAGAVALPARRAGQQGRRVVRGAAHDQVAHEPGCGHEGREVVDGVPRDEPLVPRGREVVPCPAPVSLLADRLT
mmetsp:Transcript_68072/g.175468  ORF Transcript_68072/g.175468 Transcript_68072/m.175468 type:complete len:264 (-) Transcript_68072:579-1370(-)